MRAKPPIIGIDLGTTNSLTSVLSQGEAIVIPNSIGELLTPSAVSVLPNGQFVVGAAAKARAVTHPEMTAVAFKRDMGTTKTIVLGGVTFTPQQLSALVLGSLKHDAESYLGCAVEEAVITVPAYFGDLQRQATRDAGVIAGLKVERIINEPTAAALAYGLHQMRRDVRAVVLDLGGGTFDITVLEIVEGVVEVQSSAGDARLGGDDFDSLLASAIAERVAGVTVEALRDHAASWARILEAAEQVKRRLSQADSATVALLDLPILESPSRSVEMTLARSEVEALWAPLIERMRAPIVRALSDARITPDAIAEVLLVGGSTRMPCVARLAAQMFGRMPLRTLPPDEAVALGAAVQAGLKQGDAAVEDMVVTDVAPFTLGISTVAELGSHIIPGLYTPIIDRGTVIPTSRVKQFATVRDRQTMIKVEVFQGEHSLCRDNQALGELLVDHLAPAPAGEQAIDVRFTYDLNGILEVEVTVRSTGRKESVVLERTPGRLTKAQVDEARQQMQRLKMHPREALPNTVALSRADALFTQLTGRDRDVLGAAIAQFRLALESQEDRDIVEARDYLNVVVQSVRRST